MRIRFQADEDLNEDIVTGLLRREPAIDFEPASVVRIRGHSDEQVLRLAASQGRTVVSHDRKNDATAFRQICRVADKPGADYRVPTRQRSDSNSRPADDLVRIGR